MRADQVLVPPVAATLEFVFALEDPVCPGGSLSQLMAQQVARVLRTPHGLLAPCLLASDVCSSVVAARRM